MTQRGKQTRSQRAIEATQRWFGIILSTKYKDKMRYDDIWAPKRSFCLLQKEWVGGKIKVEIDQIGVFCNNLVKG